MLIGSLRIEIDQLPRHHEVTRDDVAVRTGERGQRARSVAIKFIGADARRNRRFVSVRRHVLIRGRVALIGSILSAILTETTTTIVTALVATTIPATVITAAKLATIIVTTLEVTAITITTILTETTTTIVTALVATTPVILTLETTTIPTIRTIRLPITPLGHTLLVSTTAELAASSSLFCHGVYPLFLRHMTLL